MDKVVKAVAIGGVIILAGYSIYQLLENNWLQEELEAISEDVMNGMEELTDAITEGSSCIEEIGII